MSDTVGVDIDRCHLRSLREDGIGSEGSWGLTDLWKVVLVKTLRVVCVLSPPSSRRSPRVSRREPKEPIRCPNKDFWLSVEVPVHDYSVLCSRCWNNRESHGPVIATDYKTGSRATMNHFRDAIVVKVKCRWRGDQGIIRYWHLVSH